MTMTEKQFLKTYNIHDFDIPLVSVDMAIFGVQDNELKVLLLKRDQHPCLNFWALPGGFVDLKLDKNIDNTASRKLKEKTGVKSPYLEQVESIGNAKRDSRGWSVTILYFALIDIEQSKSRESESIKWVSVNEAIKLELAFDHKILIEKAIKRLQSKTAYTALPIELLPKEFTLTELQRIFEIILGRKLPLKSFRRRVLTAEVVEATGKSKVSGKRKAQLYRSTGKDRDYIFPRPLQQ